MITNRDDAAVQERLEAIPDVPGADTVLQRLEERPEPFVLVPEGAGLEWGVANEIKGAPNRARLKLFVPAERPGLLVLLAYKVSQVEWSRDRYAYGVWEIPIEDGPPVLDMETLDRWLDFQVSGFHPERRPETLVRQISYDIPL